MEKLKIVIKKYWKIYLAALVISVICDLIGTLKLNIGIGTLTLFPMVFAVIFGGLLGPDIFKLFKSDECKIGGSLVLVVLAPFMAKMGISSGANLAKLVSVGPALLLQEFGNLMIMGGASDMLTGITGIYMGTFVGLPLAKKLYAFLEPKIGRQKNQEVK